MRPRYSPSAATAPAQGCYSYSPCCPTCEAEMRDAATASARRLLQLQPLLPTCEAAAATAPAVLPVRLPLQVSHCGGHQDQELRT